MIDEMGWTELATLQFRLGRVFLSLGISALAFPLNAQDQSRAPYVFESSVDMVSVAVAVTNKDGELITGLTIDDFRVFEDGVSQEIQLFAAGLQESWVELPPEMKDEVSERLVTGLLLDASGSMEADIHLLRTAVIKFLTNLPRTENLFVMDFDENIRLSQYSSDDQRLISDRIYDVEAKGWTALYDALGTFLARLYDLDGKKTLVVFSDGVDSRSTLSKGEVLDMVKMSNVTIHALQFTGERAQRSSVLTEGRFLRRIALETGGFFAVVSSLDKLDELYDRILEELFSQYTLGYVSNSTKLDGKYRKIKIEVGAKDADVRARRGYIGPAPIEESEEAHR
jgi:Ca-activated chloride channel family protein